MSSASSILPDGPWPVVVAGSGGSGTRLVAALLRAAGVYMGTRVNATEDAISFRPFNQTWLLPYLKHRLGKQPSFDPASMTATLQHCIAEHKADLSGPARPWGWKRPEFIYVLPFLSRQLPTMTFLHVVRHGLDMALSSNQNDLKRYGAAVLGWRYGHEPLPLRSLRLWMLGNLPAVEFGESTLGPRYLRVHYEALCLRPAETITALFNSLGLPADPRAAAALVTDPGTLERWRNERDSRLLLRLFEVGAPALKRLDYWEEDTYQGLRTRVGQVGRIRMIVANQAARGSHLAARVNPFPPAWDFFLRVVRAAREGRLRSALRKRWVAWTSFWLNRRERLL